MSVSGRGPVGGGGQRPGGQVGDQFPVPNPQDLRAIIQDGDAHKLVEVAEKVGKALAQPQDWRDKLTTSQIRAFFGTVRQIEMNWPADGGERSQRERDRSRRPQRELLLLRPKLAYQAARARSESRGPENLRRVLEPAIGLVGDDREQFQNFVDFFEAILAYHRAHGGRD